MRRISLAVAAVLLAAFALAPAASAARPTVAGLQIPVNYSDATGSFAGNFVLERFATQGGELVAIGELTGTVTNAAGVNQIAEDLTLSVLQVTATCDILHLELGPLDLDLLGLVIHLDRIVLDIDAESGPGNLVGNLLCGIAGLLDGNAPLNFIANLLNQLLALLG